MRLRLAIALILALAIGGGPNGTASSPDRFTVGLALFNSGKWNEAAVQLLAAAAQSPGDPVVRLTAGVALANVKRYPDAMEQFKAAARLQPDSPLPRFLLDGTYAELGNQPLSRQNRGDANRLLGQLDRQSGKPDSEQPLLASLAKYPQNAIARCLLGDLYQLQGKTEAAKQQYQRSSELATKWPKPVFNLGIANLATDPVNAVNNFARVIKMNPSNSRAYLWQGDGYLKQGDTARAVKAYQTAANNASLAAEARTRIGNAQLQAGDYYSAEMNFDVAAKQAPQDPRPIAGKAQVLEKSGKLKEAEQQYQQAAEVMAQNSAPAPSQAVVQNQMANVQAVQGNFKGAQVYYNNSLELSPTRQNADSVTRAQKAANKLDQGIAEAETALSKSPNDVGALVYLLSAYSISGNQLARVATANRLIEVDPANASSYYLDIAEARVCLGDTPNAVAAYRSAMEASPDTKWREVASVAKAKGALGLLRENCDTSFQASGKTRDGLILFELQAVQGDHAGMVDTGMALVKANQDDARLWLKLGEAYELAGNIAMADLAYSRAAGSSDAASATTAKARLDAIRSGGR